MFVALAVFVLDDADIDAFLECGAAGELKSIIERDLSVPSASSDIAELEKLVLFYHHLLTFGSSDKQAACESTA